MINFQPKNIINSNEKDKELPDNYLTAQNKHRRPSRYQSNVNFRGKMHNNLIKSIKQPSVSINDSRTVNFMSN